MLGAKWSYLWELDHGMADAATREKPYRGFRDTRDIRAQAGYSGRIPASALAGVGCGAIGLCALRWNRPCTATRAPRFGRLRFFLVRWIRGRSPALQYIIRQSERRGGHAKMPLFTPGTPAPNTAPRRKSS